MARNKTDDNGTMLATDAPRISAKRAEKASKRITIPPPDFRTFTVEVVGDSPLIVHKFDNKGIIEIEQKQQRKAKGPRRTRDPKAEFEAALYRLPGGKYGFPCSGFKQAMKSACRFVEGVTMTTASGAFMVMGDFVEIKGSKPTMRTDIVRIGKFGNKVAHIAYRPEFKNWSCTLTIRYNAGIMLIDQIVNLLQTAGFAVGVGDWRPEKSGSFGMFSVKRAK